MTATRLVVTIHTLMSFLGTLLVAAIIVYGRLSYLRLVKQYPSGAPRGLTADEVDRLAAWGRRDVVGFVVTMVYLTLFSIVVGLLPPTLQVTGEIGLLALLATMLFQHFAERCPICGRSLGLQSGLGLPHFCEICRVPFRPDSALARLADHFARRGLGSRYQSQRTLFGLPLLAVAMGPDAASGQARGVAKGILAIGDVAIGGLAVGGITCGVVSVGGVSAGGLAIGGLSLGLAAIGGVAIGGVSLGGMAVGIGAFGGVAIGLYSHGGLAIGLHPRGGVAIPLRPR
ncbi:MAG TPA: hypothetical protein VFO18_18410 [Methylomirabilota bacterium]|nr:hypothetical protein [Methylomirabilota bacterium]